MKQFVVTWFSVCCCCTQLCYADRTLSYRSHVVRVIDGNTLVVSNKVLQGTVTLTGESVVLLDSIKAPELDQTGGVDAKLFLESLVKNKEIVVIEHTDGDKSRGAWVFVGDDECANLRLVEEGHAWWVETHASFAVSMGKPKNAFSKLEQAFQKAKEKRKGIWATENPIPPWEWVKEHPKKEDTQPEK